MSKVEATLKIAQSLLGASYVALVYQNGQILSSGALPQYHFADALATNLAMQGSRRHLHLDDDRAHLPPILQDIPSLSLCLVEPVEQSRAVLVCLGEQAYVRGDSQLDSDLASLDTLLATILSGQSEGVARQDLLNLHDNIPAFVALVDKNLRYEFVNETYERRFSLPRQEIIGKRIPELIPEEYYVQIQDKLNEALTGKPIQLNYHVNIGENKEQRFIQSSYVPRFENGQVTGLVSLHAGRDQPKAYH